MRILELTRTELYKYSKGKMVRCFFNMKDHLQGEIKKLKTEKESLKQELEKQKILEINTTANQPSSKKPEWEKEGSKEESSDGKGTQKTKKLAKKKKRRRKKRKKRKGCGNKKKVELIPDSTHHNTLNECSCCGEDLSQCDVIDSNSRIIEDIVPPAEKTIVTEEIQERKWCPNCKKLRTAKSEKALPGSDFGINTVVLAAYCWVVCSLSLPNIQSYLNSFMTLKISTGGISKALIRLSEILKPVYDEILEDVKSDFVVWADETGWKVSGKLHWLWIFANKRSAYYWVDRSRGSPVVEKILGTLFFGVLVTDAWAAYNSLACVGKQTCMAHIFRKIRKFIEAYPQFKTVMRFYIKLRRIINDGKKLQEQRAELGEMVFQRRLKKLRERLNQLLKWKNPNPTLKRVIKMVRRQRDSILTFVENNGVPSHNNYGEYIIRKAVLKRKVSGGSKSFKGAQAYAILQSIAQTCHLRGISFPEFLRETLLHYMRTGKPLLLSEYEARTVKPIKEAA
jgi:transposase